MLNYNAFHFGGFSDPGAQGPRDMQPPARTLLGIGMLLMPGAALALVLLVSRILHLG